VRAPDIAASLVDDVMFVGKRHTSIARRRIQRQDVHNVRLSAEPAVTAENGRLRVRSVLCGERVG
jgi:hypothetical protein